MLGRRNQDRWLQFGNLGIKPQNKPIGVHKWEYFFCDAGGGERGSTEQLIIKLGNLQES